jgi:hypothetical protein
MAKGSGGGGRGGKGGGGAAAAATGGEMSFSERMAAMAAQDAETLRGFNSGTLAAGVARKREAMAALRGQFTPRGGNDTPAQRAAANARDQRLINQWLRDNGG